MGEDIRLLLKLRIEEKRLDAHLLKLVHRIIDAFNRLNMRLYV